MFKRNKKNFKLNFKTIILLFVVILMVVQIFYSFSINSLTDKNGQDKVFVVSQREGVKQIGNNLLEADLIKSKFYFEVYVWREKLEKDLQAGSYILNPNLSIKEIVRVISEGEAINDELTIKIIEGWRISDIDSYLKEGGIKEGDGFKKIAERPLVAWSSILPDFLEDVPSTANLEGFIFPDTYRIYKDASAEDIILKMLNNFDIKLTDEMRDEIKSRGKTIYEIIKMASIIEKEVRTAEDMKIVSGLFWNRIKNGQALQADATLSYYLNDKKPAHTLEELEIDTPYNTYKYRGLPPTPISNPGLNAIKAAIYPGYTNYNYFLSRPDTGETVFSATYDEHLRNKAKYLK